VLTDHASDLLLCPSELAVENLREESVLGDIELVGDVMVDMALAMRQRALDRTDVVESYGLQAGDFVLATAHRAGNVDDRERLGTLVDLLLAIPHRVLLPLHPRTRERLEQASLLGRLEHAEQLTITPPLGYLELTALLYNAGAVLTDSGGLHKEAYLAGVPCVTMRQTTEWKETVANGWNVLVGLDRERALAALERTAPSDRPPLYGDGHAGERVVAALTLRYA